ncbi:MAG: hypothetical protein Q9223_004201 [Gallowayella weberi]
MAPPALPREIRLHIFESCSSISDAVHLAETARTFNDTWSHFTRSICEIILSRTVKYYEGAKVLVTAQETGLSPTDQEHILAYFSNAKIVEQALDALQQTPTSASQANKGASFTYRVHSNRFRGRSAEVVKMTETERARFGITYYRLCALSIVLAKCGDDLATTPIPRAAADLLDALSDYDLSLMHQLSLGCIGLLDETKRLTLGMVGTASENIVYIDQQPPDARLHPWESATFVTRKCVSKRFNVDLFKSNFISRFFAWGIATLFDCCQDDFQRGLVKAANLTAPERAALYQKRKSSTESA